MRYHVCFGLGLAAFLFFASTEPASAAGSLEDAKRHFDTAQRLYASGEHEKAATEFLVAYDVKPYPNFLFNAAVAYEKARKYQEAVTTFKRYLTAAPDADDRADVEKRIATLEEEIARRSDATTQPAEGPALPSLETKGLVVIDSDPIGADIYLNERKGKPLGSTPWSGTLDGSHTVILELRGYQRYAKKITPGRKELYHLDVVLTKDEKLGWLELSANIPGALVYLDRRDIGAIGQTPFRGNVERGKHTLYVSKPGYEEVSREITIKPGEVHKVDVQLQEAPVGIVRVQGMGLTGGKVKVDGKTACKPAPCEFEAQEGNRTVVVEKDGKKDFETRLEIQRRTQTTLTVKMADTPSRWDALGQFAIAGVGLAGGYFIYSKAGDWGDEDDNGDGDIMDDEKGSVGGPKIAWQIGGGLVATVGAIAFIRGVYFLFRDKGPPSTGKAEVQSMSFAPFLREDYAGAAAVFRF